MLRTVFGWLAGTSIVPGIALIRFWLSAHADAHTAALRFALSYVWPVFAFVGLAGFYLVRLRSHATRAWLFLATGVLTGAMCAVAAPIFFVELQGKQFRMLGPLILDGVFSFIVYWCLAVGRERLDRAKGAMIREPLIYPGSPR